MRQEKRASKKDLQATNISDRFAGDESQVQWCLQSGYWLVIGVAGKVSPPNAPAGAKRSNSEL